MLLQRMLEIKAEAKVAWLKNADPHLAVATLMAGGEIKAAMVGGLCVLYSSGAPWYSHKRILHETGIVRLYPGGKLTDVLSYLESEAELVGACTVVLGTAASHRSVALQRLYQNAGYTFNDTVLVKLI